MYFIPSNKRRLTLFFIAITSSIFVASAPALAETHDGLFTRSKIVSHHDLDLSSAPDLVVLRHRIKRAAKNVCEPVGIDAMLLRRQIRECVDDAAARAWSTAESKIAGYRIINQAL